MKAETDAYKAKTHPAEAARPTNAAAAIERFQAFMRENPVAARNVSVRELIDEGRA